MNQSDHNLKIGDIFYSAYGYGFKLKDFWEIINITEKSVVFAHLEFEVVEDHGEWDRLVRPIPKHYSLCGIILPVSVGSDKLQKQVSLKEASKITKRLTSYSHPDYFDGSRKSISLRRYKDGELVSQSWTYHLIK